MNVRERIVAAIEAERERQARAGRAVQGLDARALAEAVLRAAGLDAPTSLDEGITPDNLNATNDA